jgi:HSP20 family protein
MLARSLFPRNLYADFDQLQRELQGAWQSAPAIRGLGRGGFPALNVGTSAEAVEVCVFAPGMDPAGFDVQVERGVLSVSGERPSQTPASDQQRTLHLSERFAGRFRRVVSLPDDVDAAQVSATYRDGVLRVRLARRRAQEARRITVQ